MQIGRIDIQNTFRTMGLALFLMLINGCSNQPKKMEQSMATNANSSNTKSGNPVVYFEIPVINMDRAIKFYQSVFEFEFLKDSIDNNEMALFPFKEDARGISGALAKGSIYKPSKTGTLIYFNTTDMDKTLVKVEQNGGRTLYPKTSIGNAGFVAEFEDSEGNRIALYLK